MVSAFFSDLCNINHYFHTGAETALSGGCSGGRGAGGACMEFL